MKKKLFSIGCILLAAAFIFTACSGNSSGGSFDTSRNVSIIAREDGSGTKTAFMDIIGLRGMADPANVIIQTGTAGVLAEVRGNPMALAYESLGFISGDVKKISVDGAAPTVENILNGSYKIARPLSVVIQDSGLQNELNAAFFSFMLSSDAGEIITAEGYVAVNLDAEAYVAAPSLSGSLDISGSTSVQPLMIALAAAFEGIHTDVIINVSGGGSGTGYSNAEGGVSDFGMISEEFNSGRAPSCTYAMIAQDGIAIIVHPNNPLDNISMEQLRTLYDADAGDNAIRTWNQLIG